MRAHWKPAYYTIYSQTGRSRGFTSPRGPRTWVDACVCSVLPCALFSAPSLPGSTGVHRPQLKLPRSICLFTTTTVGAHRGASSDAGWVPSGRDLLHRLRRRVVIIFIDSGERLGLGSEVRLVGRLRLQHHRCGVRAVVPRRPGARHRQCPCALACCRRRRPAPPSPPSSSTKPGGCGVRAVPPARLIVSNVAWGLKIPDSRMLAGFVQCRRVWLPGWTCADRLHPLRLDRYIRLRFGGQGGTAVFTNIATSTVSIYRKYRYITHIWVTPNETRGLSPFSICFTYFPRDRDVSTRGLARLSGVRSFMIAHV